MKKQIKKRAVFLLLCAVSLSLFSGCNKILDASAKNQDSPEEQTGHEPITIVTGGVNYTPFIEALKKVYPEIDLETISYRGGNQSGYFLKTLEEGDIPDIYSSNYFCDEDLQMEYLLDLSSYDFVNNYVDTILDDSDVNGRIYLLPSRYSVNGIAYNKTMFEENGWEVPTSFKELKKLAKKITKDTDIVPVAAEMNLAGHPFNWFFSLNSTGFFGTPAGMKWKQDFLEGKATAVGNIEQCAEYYKKWVDAGFITDEDASTKDAATRFYNGEIAMLLTLNTTQYVYADQLGIDFEMGIMPWLSEDGENNMLTTQVSRYYGLNKELSEPGNEQKLEDALKVMEFLSTEEGELSLVNNDTSGLVLPIKESEIEEDSALYEVHDLLDQGYTAPLVYSGWNKHLIYPIADELFALTRGEITPQEFAVHLDEINKEILQNPNSDVIAVAKEDFSKEQVARMSGMAMMECTGADAALVSIGGIEDNCYENSRGVNAGIYQGNITQEDITIFTPYGTGIVTAGITGRELKELEKNGRLFQIQPGSYQEKPDETEVVEFSLPYVLTVKDDEELEDGKTYQVALNMGDYNEDVAEGWENLTQVDGETVVSAVTAWLEEEEHHYVSADSLKFSGGGGKE